MDPRYARNVPALSEAECELLRRKRVLVVGCGGLGGHLIDMLAGKPFPCSRYCFENGGLHIFAMPENKELDPLPYSEVERVGENASYFFIFRDQFGGYMVPKDALGDKVDGFRKFIEEKTGKPVALKASPFRRMLARMKRREDEPYHL